VTFNVIQNPPGYAVVNLEQSDVPGLAISANNAGPLAGSVGSKALPRSSLRHVGEDIGTAYAHFWSGAIEHQLSRAFLVATEYSGSAGRNLYSIEDWNRPGAGNVWLGDPCTPGNSNSRLLNTQYTGINTRGALGFSDYHALNTRVDIRSWKGLDMRANWTWSHAIDNLSTTFSSSFSNFNLGLLDPTNPGIDKGDADFDLRHRFTFTMAYTVPTLPDANPVVKHVLGGWSINPIFTASTGRAFSMWDSTNASARYIRAQFTGDVPRSGNTDRQSIGTNLFSLYDVSALPVDSTWVHPITGNTDFGPYPATMSGRNIFRGPGLWNLDLGIHKNFQVSESMKVQFRAEAYNTFNHSNLYVQFPDTDISATNYIPLKRGTGQRQTDERRNVQLALRFEF
jgi:hypothetical protein